MVTLFWDSSCQDQSWTIPPTKHFVCEEWLLLQTHYIKNLGAAIHFRMLISEKHIVIERWNAMYFFFRATRCDQSCQDQSQNIPPTKHVVCEEWLLLQTQYIKNLGAAIHFRMLISEKHIVIERWNAMYFFFRATRCDWSGRDQSQRVGFERWVGWVANPFF